MKAPLIMLIEDDKAIGEVMSDILALEGYESVLAYNGHNAVETLEKLPRLPILIISDLMMPVMDGMQFRAWQLKQPRFAQIPFILISAASQVNWPKELEPVTHIKKPIDLEDFLNVINQMLDQGKS